MAKDTEAIRALDIFCGAGGSSTGARMAGVTIVGGVDLWFTAIETFKLNFPDATTWNRRIERLSGSKIKEKLGKIDLLLASPECTNHTFAKGNRREGEEQEKSRRTAFAVTRYAEALEPRWIVVENVVSMRRWTHYDAWKKKLIKLGYHIKEVVLDAKHFGVAQSRRRLYVICDKEGEPATPKRPRRKRRNVKHILHSEKSNGFSYAMSRLFWNRPKRAEDTKDRARRAIDSLGTNKPFLIVYYGTDAAGGWQSLNRPLRTITTLDRFALVKPTKNGHVMRMLQPPELAAAMGFPGSYKWPKNVTRRERIKLVGNAVCPPVMQSVVAALIKPRNCS